MSSLDSRMWDRLAGAINARLPEWATYSGSGHSTKAIGGYLYAAGMMLIAALAYPRGYTVVAIAAGIVMLFALSLGRYYQSAAEVRVECNQCGEPARGESTCPHCGELTYVGGSQ
ncbi:MAG: hypothetical protein RI560_04420 [Natronomonas sp.]|nr:hypothetical protein [Natronomonas sp.]